MLRGVALRAKDDVLVAEVLWRYKDGPKNPAPEAALICRMVLLRAGKCGVECPQLADWEIGIEDEDGLPRNSQGEHHAREDDQLLFGRVRIAVWIRLIVSSCCDVWKVAKVVMIRDGHGVQTLLAAF
jgi:hypothetical protein